MHRLRRFKAGFSCAHLRKQDGPCCATRVCRGCHNPPQCRATEKRHCGRWCDLFCGTHSYFLVLSFQTACCTPRRFRPLPPIILGNTMTVFFFHPGFFSPTATCLSLPLTVSDWAAGYITNMPIISGMPIGGRSSLSQFSMLLCLILKRSGMSTCVHPCWPFVMLLLMGFSSDPERQGVRRGGQLTANAQGIK